jgi:hypothetical protein
MVGYVVFNEAKVSYDNGVYENQISVFVHEVLHALFFHPVLFEYFPNNRFGESFLFRDLKDGVYKLRGDNVMKAIQNHFGCKDFNGGKHFIMTIFVYKFFILEEKIFFHYSKVYFSKIKNILILFLPQRNIKGIIT